MRAMILAAAICLGSVAAFAGPSDHWSRQPADRVGSQSRSTGRNAPYALTGQRGQRRVMVTRDVPRGHGQTESVSYWAWVSE
jgi:hypothetical protein